MVGAWDCCAPPGTAGGVDYIGCSEQVNYFHCSKASVTAAGCWAGKGLGCFAGPGTFASTAAFLESGYQLMLSAFVDQSEHDLLYAFELLALIEPNFYDAVFGDATG